MKSVSDNKKLQQTHLTDRAEDEIPDGFIDALFQAYHAEQTAVPDDCDQSLKAVAYAMDELQPDEKQKTYQHLLTCRPCFDLVSDVRQAEHDARKLGNREVEVSQEISDAIDEKQRAGSNNGVLSFSSSKAIEHARQWFSTLFTPKFVSVMAMACILIVVAIYSSDPLGRYFEQVIANVQQSIPDSSPSPPTLPSIKLQSEIIKATIDLLAISGPISTRGLGGIQKEFKLKKGATLKTGDHFQIKISADKDAYCYLLLADGGTGQITELFRGEIRAGHPKVISEGAKGFRLGVYRGVKTVYMLASAKEIEDFDAKMQKLQKGGEERIKTLFPKVSVQMFHFEHK